MVGRYVRGNMLLPKCVMIHDDETCHDTCLQNLRSRHHERRTPDERKLSNVVSPTRLSKEIQLVFFARSLNLERAIWAQCLFELMVCVSCSASCKSFCVQNALNDMSFDMHKETNKKGYCICPNLYHAGRLPKPPTDREFSPNRYMFPWQVPALRMPTAHTRSHSTLTLSGIGLTLERCDWIGGLVPGKQGADVGLKKAIPSSKFKSFFGVFLSRFFFVFFFPTYFWYFLVKGGDFFPFCLVSNLVFFFQFFSSLWRLVIYHHLPLKVI